MSKNTQSSSFAKKQQFKVYLISTITLRFLGFLLKLHVYPLCEHSSLDQMKIAHKDSVINEPPVNGAEELDSDWIASKQVELMLIK